MTLPCASWRFACASLCTLNLPSALEAYMCFSCHPGQSLCAMEVYVLFSQHPRPTVCTAGLWSLLSSPWVLPLCHDVGVCFSHLPQPTIWSGPRSMGCLCIGEGNGNLLQCSYLDNPRDSGAWWAAVYGVAQSQTWLKRLSSSSSSIGVVPYFDEFFMYFWGGRQSPQLTPLPSSSTWIFFICILFNLSHKYLAVLNAVLLYPWLNLLLSILSILMLLWIGLFSLFFRISIINV